MDPKIRLGSLVAPSGRRTKSEGETLDFVLATHFPNSIVIESGPVPAAACGAKRLDWLRELSSIGECGGRLIILPI